MSEINRFSTTDENKEEAMSFTNPLFKGRALKKEVLDLSEMPKSAIPEEIQKRFIKIVGIRFSEGGRVYDFDAKNYNLGRDEKVIAEVPEKGIQLGWVAKPSFRIDNTHLDLKLKPLIRIAKDHDIEQNEKRIEKEKKNKQIVVDLVSRHKLEMHIVGLEYTLDLKKCIIYFVSESRVDFRSLLKDLVNELKARIELRQIGARDETKMKGGIGPCGEELCCSRFIGKFHPVSIKMAKLQGLSLKPTKVSGNCGRLKCCLAYEYKVYEQESKKAPHVGSKCKKCDNGRCGVIKDVDVLNKMVTVQFEDGGFEILKASEIIEEQSSSKKYHKNEKLVASKDKNETEEEASSEDK